MFGRPNLANCCQYFIILLDSSFTPSRCTITFCFAQVITSKQRPRRLCVRGSNGKDYMFLLKGHEDLRQDERVMQLFGLVNTLLQADPDTFRRDLAIQRYAVIPLSTNSGLIGWVPHCDTLHSLIRDYREKRKCLLNIEHRIMQRMASDLEKLMLMQKVSFKFITLSEPENTSSRIKWCHQHLPTIIH
jgi:phosphatidylinositol kinase/protein kinase (PI-3  family)